MSKTFLAEKQGVCFEMLTEKDLEQTVACVTETFTTDEPLTSAVNISPNEFHPFANMYCVKAISDGLSVIARDKVTRKVIAFLISEALASEAPKVLEEVSEKFRPIMALLDRLDQQYKSNLVTNSDQILRLFMGGVSKDYRGRNILAKLIAENIEIAKRHGFSVAIGEATGPGSEYILVNKFDFKHQCKIYYRAFAYQGVNVFESIKAAHYCVLVAKRLG